MSYISFFFKSIISVKQKKDWGAPQKHTFWISQEENLCSLVLKLAVFPSTYRSTTTRCIVVFLLFFAPCTRYFFQRDTSSESNCNSNCWGQPSSQNRFCIPDLFTLHVQDLHLCKLHNKKRDTPTLSFHYLLHSVFIVVSGSDRNTKELFIFS